MRTLTLWKYIKWMVGIAGIFFFEAIFVFNTALFIHFFLYFLLYLLFTVVLIVHFENLSRKKTYGLMHNIYLSLIFTLVFLSIILPFNVLIEFLDIKIGNILPMYAIFLKGLINTFWKSFFVFIASVIVVPIVLKLKKKFKRNS